MMRRARGMRIVLFVCSILALSLLIPLSPINAQTLTHKVEKGDTLWSICEKYYGDADLWPKLWQMNPFITNPHFLHPGDIITLIEKESLEKARPKQEKPADMSVKASAPEKPPMKGIDISSLTKSEAIGYLSPGREFRALGKIVSTNSSRLFLTKGDEMSVVINKGGSVAPGTQLSIVQISPLLDHPRTGKTLGYIVDVRGHMVIEEEIDTSVYKARITDSFKQMGMGDFIIPFEPFSSCIEPTPADDSLKGCIAAAKGQARLLGRHSIVYLDLGFNQGVRRGNLFEVIETKSLTVPKTDLKRETLDDYFHSNKQVPLPDKRIGLLLILESRPTHSTALILAATEMLPIGSLVKGLSWAERPEILSTIPACALE